MNTNTDEKKLKSGELCQSCGACCGNPLDDVDAWAGPLSHIDYARLPEALRGRLEVRMEEGYEGIYMPQMLAPNGHRQCVALVGEIGGTVGCSIYDQRPEVCRTYEPGSFDCRQVRILRGVDPLPPIAQMLREKLERRRAT